jgi:RNA polymerase sigma-70 factor (ECF subfamily)
MASPQPKPTPDSLEAEPALLAQGPAQACDSDLSPAHWAGLVGMIRRGEAAGLEELYRIFSRGIRFFMCRQLGPMDLDDRVHDTFLIVVQAIGRGELREPERLMGFVRTVVRRQVAAYIEQAILDRKRQMELGASMHLGDGQHNPEQKAISRQKYEIAKSVLDGSCRRDREILTRFYLQEQSREQICLQMRLTQTQFRLLKSRAKARFARLGRRKLARRGFRSFLKEKFHSATALNQ